MAETLPKTPGDQAPVGYRPLPGSSNSRGPDLKSLAFATVGVALGIVVGTIMADGSWRSLVPGMTQRTVLAIAATAKPYSPAAGVKVSLPLLSGTVDSNRIHVAERFPTKPSAGPRPSSVAPIVVARAAQQATQPRVMVHEFPPSSPADGAQTAPAEEKPVYRAYDPAFNAYAQKVARDQAAVKTRAVQAAYDTSYPRFAAPPRQHTERRPQVRRTSWRKAHRKHRLHAHLRAAAQRPVPQPALVDAAPVARPEPFAFNVEGSVTVSNYDPAEGRIQTYEGETFVLDKSNVDSKVSGLSDYPADLHYICNQSWNCTLAHSGAAVLSARRVQ